MASFPFKCSLWIAAGSFSSDVTKKKKSFTMPQQIIQIVLNACWWHQFELNVWVGSAASGSELLQHFLSITTLSPSAIFLFSLSLGRLKNMLKLLLAHFPLPVYSPKSAEMGLFNVFFSFTLYLVTPNPWAWEEQRRYLFTYFIVVLSKDTSWKVVCTSILFSFFYFYFFMVVCAVNHLSHVDIFS